MIVIFIIATYNKQNHTQQSRLDTGIVITRSSITMAPMAIIVIMTQNSSASNKPVSYYEPLNQIRIFIGVVPWHARGAFVLELSLETLVYKRRLQEPCQLGLGVPYFNTFFLKGTIVKYKFILFSPWLLKSPVK